jgi:hypothetical protein
MDFSGCRKYSAWDSRIQVETGLERAMDQTQKMVGIQTGVQERNAGLGFSEYFCLSVREGNEILYSL